MLELTLPIGSAVQSLPGNPFKFTDLGVFIGNAIGVGITLAGVGALVYLLWGGVDWIVSGGDKTAVENARNKITHAIIGLAIVVAIWAVFGLVQTFLGIRVTGEKQINKQSWENVVSSSYSQPQAEGFKCPGPNCDRCPGATSRPAQDIIPCNNSLWIKNAECKTLYPGPSSGCTKN